MPQNALQKWFFMSLTVLLSVTAFTTYNVALSRGSMSNEVFLLAMREIPVEFILALFFESAFAYKAAERLAFRLVDPSKDRPIVIILAITSMTVCLMCPLMSLAAVVLYNGVGAEFISAWFQKIIFNFPFAFFSQVFFIGPLVRLAFRSVFRNRGKAAAA